MAPPVVSHLSSPHHLVTHVLVYTYRVVRQRRERNQLPKRVEHLLQRVMCVKRLPLVKDMRLDYLAVGEGNCAALHHGAGIVVGAGREGHGCSAGSEAEDRDGVDELHFGREILFSTYSKSVWIV